MDFLKSKAANVVAADITLSDDSCSSLRHWRQVFGIRQSDLAKRLLISPSVISDYESGRRRSPGTNFVKKYVKSLVDMDSDSGGRIMSRLAADERPDGILAMKEISNACGADDFIDLIDGTVIANSDLISKRTVRGYTVIDSIQAILDFKESDFKSIYGLSTERALIFTKVKMGRSPMIAIKVTSPKPGLMVLHGLNPEDVDSLAVHIAQKERIPLVVCGISDEKQLIEKLGRELN